MVYRMTVVPGYNDQAKHLSQLASFISSTGRKEINLLPLHHLGREKYALTGRPYYSNVLDTPTKESMLNIEEILELKGIVSYIGSDTPF